MNRHHDLGDNRDDTNGDRQNTSDNNEEQQQPNSDTQTQTFVFSGDGGATLLATMQAIMNRIFGQGIVQPMDMTTNSHSEPTAASEDSHPSASEDTEMLRADDNEMPSLMSVTGLPSSVANSSEASSGGPQHPSESHPHPFESATNESNSPGPDMQESNTNSLPRPRPIRPLPRPHAHIHAHTPGGIIDLFTFNIGETPPPPARTGAASFTVNVGPEFFENVFLNGGFIPKDREPDFERAKTLLREMEVVPGGLVRRLERTGGVSGAQGGEEFAGCAVCYGRLLESVESGEWDNTQQKAAKEKAKEDSLTNIDDDEFQGRIVALPCAHVYHAECLLPWFARNTTCPTCRFDIDPDSLTWKPQPPPPPPSEPDPEYVNPNPTNIETHWGAGSNATEMTEEQIREASMAEAARLSAFMESLFRGGAPANDEGQSDQTQTQSQPAQHAQEAPSSPPQPAQSEPHNQRQPPPQFSSFALPLRHAFGFGPERPLQPVFHGIPSMFRTQMPMFVVPPQQQQQQPQPPHEPRPSQGIQLPSTTTQAESQAQPRPEAQAQAQVQAQAQHTQPQTQAQLASHIAEGYFRMPIRLSSPNPFPLPAPVYGGAFPMFMGPMGPMGPLGTAGQQQQQPQQPRRKWTPPDPVGKTLRQRVEAKERELGLRCDDPSCGLAPEDDDEPESVYNGAQTQEEQKKLKRVKLRAGYDAHGRSCEHEFHPECLVRNTRVSGSRDSRPIVFEDGKESTDVLVQCPVCRAEGWLWKEEWEEGCAEELY